MKKINLDVLKAAEFKQLIEQYTANGKVDTIPELMERIGEVPDDMSLEDFIRLKAEQSTISEDTLRQMVDDIMAAVIAAEEAEEADIDEIFPELMEDSSSSSDDSAIPAETDDSSTGTDDSDSSSDTTDADSSTGDDSSTDNTEPAGDGGE